MNCISQKCVWVTILDSGLQGLHRPCPILGGPWRPLEAPWLAPMLPIDPGDPLLRSRIASGCIREIQKQETRAAENECSPLGYKVIALI